MRARRREDAEAVRAARLAQLLADLAAIGDDDGPERVAALAAGATRDVGPGAPAKFLEAVRAACDTALDRLRLRDAERRRLANQAFLADASLALAGARGADALLATLCKLVVPHLADGCTVEHGDASADDDDDGDPHVLRAPLRGHSGVLATLVLERADSTFDAFDRMLADELATRAGPALDAALAFDEQAKASVTLQRSLLPTALVPVAGLAFAARYVAAVATQEVGGDFYDAIARPDGSAVLVIGDVQGKGIDAATITSAARHTLRAGALDGLSPAVMLQRANAAMLYGHAEHAHAGDDDPRFVTAAVVALTPAEGGFQAVAASGGHPPPLVVRADGTVHELRAAGMVLGVVDDPEFTEVHADLALADTVVLYTDGVTEQATSLDFDEAELGRLVRNRVGPADADAVAQLILDTVLLLAPGQPRDDLAVLVACVTSTTR